MIFETLLLHPSEIGSPNHCNNLLNLNNHSFLQFIYWRWRQTFAFKENHNCFLLKKRICSFWKFSLCSLKIRIIVSWFKCFRLYPGARVFIVYFICWYLSQHRRCGLKSSHSENHIVQRIFLRGLIQFMK